MLTLARGEADLVLLVWVVMGCTDGTGATDSRDSGTDDPTEATGETGTEPNGIDCGETGTFSMTLRGRVVDQDETPVSFADITFEERNWAPQLFDTTVSDKDGFFEVSGLDMPYAEKCWGTGLQFWVNGETKKLQGSQPMNSWLLKGLAADVETLEVSAPMVLRPR